MALTTIPASLSATALTLTTAAQPNITSTGILNALSIAGNLTVDTGTLHVDATNNRVGIGTTSPASPLTINGSDPLITFENGESSHWQLGFENTQSDRFVIYDNNASAYRLVINSTGNVGLNGNTNPTGKLHIGSGSSSAAISGSADDLVLDNAGNAGITIATGSSAIASLFFADAASNASGYIQYTHSNDALAFATNNAAEAMRIDGNGNVGIGTDTPSSLLHIASTGAPSIKLEDTDNGFAATELNIENGGRDFKITTPQDTIFVQGSTESMRILSSGNVGIGTDTPAVELDIKRRANDYPLRVGSETGQGRAIVFADVAGTPTKYNWIAGTQYNVDNSFEITPSTAVGGYTFSSPALVIRQSGNVGIGTSNPGAKLDVVGATATPLVLELSTGNSNCDITMQSASSSSVTRLRNSTNDFQIHTSSGENLRINSSASPGHLQMGVFGITGLNTVAAIHGVGNDAALVLSNGNLANSNSSYGWAGRGGRYLTSNGTNWDTDGRDPALVIGQNTATDNRGQGIGIILHNESNTNGHYGPIVGWGTKSESNSYNTMYAYIVGKKTGAGTDTNWSKGELQFDTAGLKPNGSNAYMTNTPSMIIDDSGAVTKPHQPHIRLHGNSATRVTNHGSTVTAFTNFNIATQRGITFNSGNGLVTLPVGGTYLIQYSFYLWMNNVGHGVSHSVALYRNSSMQQESIWESPDHTPGGSYIFDNTLSNSLILDCAAGDTLRWQCYADIYGGTVHTNASVYLLG